VADPLNQSYYAATANPLLIDPAADAAFDVDVVVIGGGFTGLSAALACAEKGYRVTLIEAEMVGFGASGRNGGQLIPGLRWTMREIDAAFGRSRAHAIFDLAWNAQTNVRNRIARHDIECDIKPGHFEAAYKAAHFGGMAREAEFLSKNFGYETELVSMDGVANHINGGNYHGGVYDQHGGHFHPLNYARGLAKAAQEAGVTIIEGHRVCRIVDNGAVEIFLDQSTVKAKFAVIATDSWTGDVVPDLGRFTVQIMNYNIATAPLPDALALLPSDAAVADSRFVLNYFRLSADKRLVFGGGEKYTTRMPSDVGGFVRKHMVEVFPSLATTSIDYAWGGAVSVTMNRLPHFGRHGNCFYAHGFSGHGALLSTLAGELIAEALRGTAERFDVFANLPHRPFPGGRWLRNPLAALGLFWYALRDRL
jgi:gamma-glutamylputrescine oxidase